MSWREHPQEEPQHGQKIPPPVMAQIVAEHRLVIEAEQDRIYEGIRDRLGPAHPRIMPKRV